MRDYYFLLLGICFALVGNAQPCANEANIYQLIYNGNSYEIVREQKSWSDAAACAVERGGYLLQINDQTEQDSIYDAIINGAGVSPTYTTVNDGGGIAYVWTGGSDVSAEGDWIWDGNGDGVGTSFWSGQGNAGAGGGMPVGGAYINWGGTSLGTPNEPDDYLSNQDGAGIALASWPYGVAGEWNDIDAANTLYFVIEYDGVTGMEQHGERNPAMVLYPNPAKEALNIRSDSQQYIAAFEVRDEVGRIVIEQSGLKQQSVSLTTGDLKPGVHIVSVIFEDGSQVHNYIIID